MHKKTSKTMLETLDDIAETSKVPDIEIELSRLFGQNVIIQASLCLITQTSSGTLQSTELLFTAFRPWTS